MSNELFQVSNKAGKTRYMVTDTEESCRILCKELKFVSRTKHLIVVDVTQKLLNGDQFSAEENDVYVRNLPNMVEGMSCCKFEDGKTTVGVFCNIFKKMHEYQ